MPADIFYCSQPSEHRHKLNVFTFEERLTFVFTAGAALTSKLKEKHWRGNALPACALCIGNKKYTTYTISIPPQIHNDTIFTQHKRLC